jgi:hypothetical protein
MPGNFDVQINGPSCPIMLSLSLAIKMEPNGGNGTFKCEYEVRDASYSALNDVNGMNIEGAMDFQSSSNGDGSGKVDIKGKIHSQKNGDVQISLKADGSGNKKAQKGSATARFDFAKFSLELKQTHENGKDVFSINDEEVSKEEFYKAFGKNELTNSLGTMGGNGGSSSSSPFFYSFTFNGCSTELQEFSSLEEECKGLQSDSRNHGCALGDRLDEFNSKCQGTFTPSS